MFLFFGVMKKALLQLNSAVFIWGFTGVLGRAITLDSVLLVWYRLAITVLTLWIGYGVLKKFTRLPASSVLYIGLIGAVQAAHWVCFYGSIKYANVTIALTCLSTTALLSSLIEPVVLKKKFDAIEVFLGLFAIAGIVIIYNTHIQFSIGIIIGLLSALLTVIVSVLNKKIINRYAPEEITLYQLSGGFAGITLCLPFVIWLQQPQQLFPSGLDWLWLLILSWLCTIFTFYLYIRSLKKVSAFTLNLLLTLEPVYGILLAFLIYKENELLNQWFYLGFGLIAVAVLFHIWHLVKPSKEVN